MMVRMLVLTATALIFAIIIASVHAATFAPAGSPYNGGDGAASCPPAAGLPSPSNPPALNTVTCTETGGSSAVTVNWVSDTPSGSQTDNAWGQGTQSDCHLAKAGGNAAACVSAVTGIGASKTDLQDFGLGIGQNASEGHF